MKFKLKACLSVGALLLAHSALANNVTVLNNNFEFDAIPTETGQTDRISGWVNSGFGDIGVESPADGATGYNMIDGRAQIAFLKHGGRISQTVSAVLEVGETYTLHYDVGQQNGQANANFVARIKANGATIAQLQSNHSAIKEGEWKTLSLDVTATTDMPIGHPIVLEFANLSTNAGEQVDLDNVVLMTAGTGMDSDPITSPGAGMSTGMIIEDMTLNVPDDHANITDALAYLSDKRIKVGKTVTISVNDCSNQEYNRPIFANHPDGKSIHIMGNTLPTLCYLGFGTAVDGFVVKDGNTIGLIDGFNIIGTFGYVSSGIRAQNGATIQLGESMRVAGFHYGVHAERNATIIANGIQAPSNGDSGFYSDTGGFIQANGTNASYNGTTGYFAEQNGIIEATRSTANTNGTSAYSATTSGYVNASLSTVTGFTPIPLSATSNAQINAYNVTVNGGFVRERDERSHGVITDERKF